MTKQLAQNLVAIGMATLLCRMNRTAFHCCLNHPKKGCCQDERLDTLSSGLTALGKDPWTT
jgi:hypothetical protein